MPVSGNKDFEQRLQKAVEEIRAFIRQDGGDLRIVRYNEDEIVVQFLGNCMHCSIKALTLNTGIKAIFKKYLPEVKHIKEYTHEQH